MALQRNVVFVWIPRTGGQSIWLALSHLGPELRTRAYWNDPTQFNGEHVGAACFGHYSLPSLVEKGIVAESYLTGAFKFCFIRNPFERLVSWFARQSSDTATLKQSVSEACDLFPDIQPIGFYNSIALSCLNPMVSWFAYDLSFIGRYENYDADFDILCEVLEIPTTHRPGKSANKSQHGPYRMYYSPTARKQAEEFYQVDCETFGYEF